MGVYQAARQEVTVQTAWLVTLFPQRFHCIRSVWLMCSVPFQMDSQLSADKKIEQLSLEELRFVFNQITDHNLPESKKCALVQRLNAESAASSNDTSSSSLQANNTRSVTHSTSSDVDFKPVQLFTKDVDYRESGFNFQTDSAGNLVQSLPEPGDIAEPSKGVIAVNGVHRKYSRANSFTMSATTQSDGCQEQSLTNGTCAHGSSDTIEFELKCCSNHLCEDTQFDKSNEADTLPIVDASSPSNFGDFRDEVVKKPQSALQYYYQNYCPLNKLNLLVESVEKLSDSAPQYQNIVDENILDNNIEYPTNSFEPRKVNIVEYSNEMSLEPETSQRKEGDGDKKSLLSRRKCFLFFFICHH